jgi:short-subunit dehydrogenase
MASKLKSRFGPTALITGASDGIGRAFAEALAIQGLDLVLVARREAVLLDLARDLGTTHGVSVQVIAVDLSRPRAVAEILARTEGKPIGLLVASAGFGSSGPFLAQDVASEVNMVDVNCRSVVELTHGFATRMAAQGRGGVVLFSSVVGFSGAPFSSTYAATKGFVQSFAEGLAVELRPQGISVLSVAPGPVGTGFAARAGMQMGKAEKPETVARVSLAAQRRGGTVRPGILAKLLGWSLAVMPRWGRVRVLGLIMKGASPKAKG